MKSPNKILGFFGPYRFLSNFYSAEFGWEFEAWPTSEHAYQAAKCVSLSDYVKIHESKSPSEAKSIGKRVSIWSDWDIWKRKVMRDIVFAKFSQNPDLKEKLLDTGVAYLEETNTWGDTYWGVCNGEGRNELGKILMEVRDELRS